jgi:hypothetical protein
VLPVSTMSQWCVSRSSMAVVIFASPNIACCRYFGSVDTRCEGYRPASSSFRPAICCVAGAVWSGASFRCRRHGRRPATVDPPIGDGPWRTGGDRL